MVDKSLLSLSFGPKVRLTVEPRWEEKRKLSMLCGNDSDGNWAPSGVMKHGAADFKW